MTMRKFLKNRHSHKQTLCLCLCLSLARARERARAKEKTKSGRRPHHVVVPNASSLPDDANNYDALRPSGSDFPGPCHRAFRFGLFLLSSRTEFRRVAEGTTDRRVPVRPVRTRRGDDERISDGQENAFDAFGRE